MPMTPPTKAPKSPEPETVGARIGAKLRMRANTQSDVVREAARQRGMQLIYGNDDSRKVHAPSR